MIHSAHITGFGEVFYNKDVPLFIKLLKQADPRVKIDITTNGTLITEPVCRMLIEQKINRLVVSIDGASPATYGQYRVGGNFDAVIANVKKTSSSCFFSGEDLMYFFCLLSIRHFLAFNFLFRQLIFLQN